jgi:gliding motility-associated-like protein
MACLSLPYGAFSQNILPPNQPEQDACNALPLCGGTFTQPYSYQGTGTVVSLDETPCWSPAEFNVMWMKVQIANAGSLSFKIIPVDSLDDYDFAVLDVTNTACNQLTSANVVRCNYNVDTGRSCPAGIVGLSDSGTVEFVQSGAVGYPFVQAINATAGQTYLILINNYGHDEDPGPSNGFTIDFTTSTATFQSNQPSQLQSTVKSCSDSSVAIQLSAPIQCNSIAADGSQFSITPAVPIASASGMNCVNNGYTSEIIIHFSTHVVPGTYILNGQASTSGTNLVNLCGDATTFTSTSPSLPFKVPPPVQDNYLRPDTTKCDYSTITEETLKAFDSYLWSTGARTISISIMDPGLYTLQVTDSNDCIGLDSINIIDSVCPQYVYLPNAFTPNGDGKNDIFRPVFAGAASTFRFAVYDRWGRAVFVTTAPGAGWDGTTGGRQQPAGTYVWECVYQLYKEPERMQRGTVILIR